jgi:murein L,D-transpeptidase YcbB/YkuD
MLTVVGTAVGGMIGWSDPPPPVDAATLRTLLTAVGQRPCAGDADLTAAVRAFQSRADLAPDGVAGPRTVHALVQRARVPG